MRLRQAPPTSVACIKHHHNTDPRIPLNADKRMRMRPKDEPMLASATQQAWHLGRHMEQRWRPSGL